MVQWIIFSISYFHRYSFMMMQKSSIIQASDGRQQTNDLQGKDIYKTSKHSWHHNSRIILNLNKISAWDSTMTGFMAGEHIHLLGTASNGDIYKQKADITSISCINKKFNAVLTHENSTNLAICYKQRVRRSGIWQLQIHPNHIQTAQNEAIPLKLWCNWNITHFTTISIYSFIAPTNRQSSSAMEI